MATLREATADFQRAFVLKALVETRGSVTEAAKAVGVGRPEFYRVMKRLNVQPPPRRLRGSRYGHPMLRNWLNGASVRG